MAESRARDKEVGCLKRAGGHAFGRHDGYTNGG
jgi:hypothetical protein